MRLILLLSTIILHLMMTFPAKADTLEVLAGSLTQHLYDPGNIARNYEGKIGDEGRLIANLLLGVRFKSDEGLAYTSHTVFGGANSIREPMFGYIASTGLKLYDDGLQLGVLAGTYVQDNRKFNERDITVISIVQSGGFAIIPVVGVEANVRLWQGDRWRLGLMNVVTPVLINSSINLAFDL